MNVSGPGQAGPLMVLRKAYRSEPPGPRGQWGVPCGQTAELHSLTSMPGVYTLQ